MHASEGVTLLIPSALRPYCDGATRLMVQAATVRHALEDIRAQHESLVHRVLTRDGQLRPFVRVFVRNDDVRDLQGLDTPLHDGEVITIVPAVAGG